MSKITYSGEEKLFSGAILFSSKLLGLVFGLFSGLMVFLATNWLILKGGHVTPEGEHVIGPHLKLLGQFFIGYDVSFIGSIIGFLYGFALGSIAGILVGTIYNKIVIIRNKNK